MDDKKTVATERVEDNCFSGDDVIYLFRCKCILSDVYIDVYKKTTLWLSRRPSLKVPFERRVRIAPV